jgi:hypothetical protein
VVTLALLYSKSVKGTHRRKDDVFERYGRGNKQSHMHAEIICLSFFSRRPEGAHESFSDGINQAIVFKRYHDRAEEKEDTRSDEEIINLAVAWRCNRTAKSCTNVYHSLRAEAFVRFPGHHLSLLSMIFFRYWLFVSFISSFSYCMFLVVTYFHLCPRWP